MLTYKHIGASVFYCEENTILPAKIVKIVNGSRVNLVVFGDGELIELPVVHRKEVVFGSGNERWNWNSEDL